MHPELSTGQVTTQGGFTLPDKDLTQVTTNVMVRDGATVVIGGLIREDLTTNTTQIPLLGNLPGVGWLFRQKQESTQRNEILVLITPHIVYDCEAAAEGADGATEFHRREAVYADQMSPIGKHHLAAPLPAGARIVRRRRSAAGVRFIDLSIHFDPLDRAAIELRTDIVTGNHFGEHTAVKFPTVAASAGTMVADPNSKFPPGATPAPRVNHRPTLAHRRRNPIIRSIRAVPARAQTSRGRPHSNDAAPIACHARLSLPSPDTILAAGRRLVNRDVRMHDGGDSHATGGGNRSIGGGRKNRTG